MASEPITRVAVITGAAGHLGRVVAGAFANTGVARVLIDIDAVALTQTFGADRADQLLAPTNLLDAASLSTAAAAAMKKFGRIDILCNVAGGFRMGHPVHATPDEDWRAMIDLNAGSVLRACHAFVPHMLATGAGKIINIAATAGLRGGADMGAYAASKSAVIRLTESMSAELCDRGINVNCILPSIIDTPPNRAAMPQADPTKWVCPEALADVILFLASHQARAIHGAAIPVVGLV